MTRKEGSPRLDPAQVLKAIAFAAWKHRHQRRKDAEASHTNHPIAVATVLAAEGGVSDQATLSAAALNDTVEDTQTTLLNLKKTSDPRCLKLDLEE
jgi:guanosine-3',5'-bis(diphosphate) 3'-pyrophosphohydrolase